MNEQRITKGKRDEIYACRFDIFETHIDSIKNLLAIFKNDKSVSKEQIEMLKEELRKAQRILDSFEEAEWTKETEHIKQTDDDKQAE